jgi:hypothetical protein
MFHARPIFAPQVNTKEKIYEECSIFFMPISCFMLKFEHLIPAFQVSKSYLCDFLKAPFSIAFILHWEGNLDFASRRAKREFLSVSRNRESPSKLQA